jgi:hypothetical protein
MPLFSALAKVLHVTEMVWRSIEGAPADTEILVWCDGRARIALRVDSPGDGQASFFDPHSDELLKPPTHWMPLPAPPPGLDVRLV